MLLSEVREIRLGQNTPVFIKNRIPGRDGGCFFRKKEKERERERKRKKERRKEGSRLRVVPRGSFEREFRTSFERERERGRRGQREEGGGGGRSLRLDTKNDRMRSIMQYADKKRN